MKKTESFKKFIDEDTLSEAHIEIMDHPTPVPKNPWWKHWLSGLLLCALLLIISALILCIWALSAIVQNAHHHHDPTSPPPPPSNLLKIGKRSVMSGGGEAYKRTYPLLLQGNQCLPQSNTTAFYLHRPSNKEPLLKTIMEVNSRRRDLKSSVNLEQIDDIKEALKFNTMFKQLLTVYWLENQESGMTTCIWGTELETVYTVGRNHKAKSFTLTPSHAPEEGILCYSLWKLQLEVHWYCVKSGIEFSAKYNCGEKNEGTTDITYRKDDIHFWCLQLGSPAKDPNAHHQI